MVWALLIRATIVLFAGIEARRARSVRAALAIASGPVAMSFGAWAMGTLSTRAGAAVAAALCVGAAALGGTTAHALYAAADARRDDLTARENLESAANGVTAGAVFDGVVGFLCGAFGLFVGGDSF